MERGTLVGQVRRAGRQERLGADVMAWHERHRQQQLVFDQLGKVECPGECEHIVFRLFVEPGGRFLAVDEQEVPVDLQLVADGRKTTLALEFDRRPGAQVQPGLVAGSRRRPAFATGAPGDGSVRAFALAPAFVARIDDRADDRTLGQARQARERPTAGEFPRLLGKSGHVEPVRIEFSCRHRDECRPVQRSTGRWENPPMTSSLLRRRLILASTSRYRRELLERLRLAFSVEAPEVDETPRAGEAPAGLAARLALAKARAVAARHPDAVVIGSDQVADLDGEPLGKPGGHERAVVQLQRMRGRVVVFQTAVAVVCTEAAFEGVESAAARVRFRHLSDDQIERYLRLETPYDCAGSAKAEALGIALLEAIDSDDPTTLIGLPLIRTCRLLRQVGVDPLGGNSGDAGHAETGGP